MLLNIQKMKNQVINSDSYLVLGFIAFSFTLISSFTLSGRGPWDVFKYTKNQESSN
jgi:hypothetical protein